MDNRGIFIFLKNFFYSTSVATGPSNVVRGNHSQLCIFQRGLQQNQVLYHLTVDLQGFSVSEIVVVFGLGRFAWCCGMPVSLMVFLCRLSSLGVYELLDSRFSELQCGLLVRSILIRHHQNWICICCFEVAFDRVTQLLLCSSGFEFSDVQPLMFFPWGVLAGLRWKFKFERIRRWDMQHSAPLDSRLCYSDIG